MSFEVIIDGKDKLTVDDSDENKLGGGGQGNVYIVTYKGEKYALKWYTAKKIIENVEFRNNLRNNTKKRSPDKYFVWPQHFAENDKSYGYLMDIIDTNRFTLFSNVYTGIKRVKDPVTGKKKSVEVRFDSEMSKLNAAINLAVAFRTLHRAGMAYMDLNDGGFYIDTKTGDLLVCDCDNISASNNNECIIVLGTQGYLAPELVDDPDRYLPNMDTDKHSLAVLLYMLLIWSKPFNGKKLSNVMISESNEKEFYGRKAVFVYHPTDDSNRPTPQDTNANTYWPLMTPEVQNNFIRCFTEGITKPTKRPTENKWAQALNSMRAGVIRCACNNTEEYIIDKNVKSGKYVCPGCKSKYSMLVFDNGDRYALKRAKEIYAASISAESMTEVMGLVVGKETSQGKILLGLQNTGNMDWTVKEGNNTHTINPGLGFPFRSGIEIEFRFMEISGKDKIIRRGKAKVE